MTVEEPTAPALDFGGGVSVDAEIDEVSFAEFAELEPDAVAALPGSFTPAGSAVLVVVDDGVIDEASTISIDATAPPAGSTPVVLHLNDAGGVEANAASVVDGTYTAVLGSFSWALPGWFEDTWFDSAFDWLSGRSDEPDNCTHEPYGWVAASGAPADGSFHVCERANPRDDGTERVEVVIKSNRSMAMWITMTDFERDFVWVEGAPDWDSYGVAINELDGGPPGRVLLGPGRTMTVGFTRPLGAGPTLRFSSYQNNTTQVASLAQQYLGDLGQVGMLAAMLVCVEGANTGEGFAALSLQAAVGCLPKIAELLVTSGVSDGATAFGSVLDARYASLVAQGRLQLSVGAIDGIEALINDASATSRAATAFKAAGNALLAANLLADATSMLSDSILAFTPGLNTYTVNLVGAPDSPASSPEPTATTSRPAPTPVPPTRCLGRLVGIEQQGVLQFGEDERTVQQALADLGYNPGEIDGYFGQNSQRAALEWVQANDGVRQGYYLVEDNAISDLGLASLGLAYCSPFSELLADTRNDPCRTDDYLTKEFAFNPEFISDCVLSAWSQDDRQLVGRFAEPNVVDFLFSLGTGEGWTDLGCIPRGDEVWPWCLLEPSPEAVQRGARQIALTFIAYDDVLVVGNTM